MNTSVVARQSQWRWFRRFPRPRVLWGRGSQHSADGSITGALAGTAPTQERALLKTRCAHAQRTVMLGMIHTEEARALFKRVLFSGADDCVVCVAVVVYLGRYLMSPPVGSTTTMSVGSACSLVVGAPTAGVTITDTDGVYTPAVRKPCWAWQTCCEQAVSGSLVPSSLGVRVCEEARFAGVSRARCGGARH